MNIYLLKISRLFMLLGLLCLVAARQSQAQETIFYVSDAENPQRYPSAGYLAYVVRGLQQPALRTMPAPPEALSFALLLRADGTIREVVLNTSEPEPYATTLKNWLWAGPAQTPYRYQGQPVATVIPLALDWSKAQASPADAPEQAEAVRLTVAVQMPSPPAGILLVEKDLKALRRRLQQDLAGQTLVLELGMSAQGRVELWRTTNLKDPALAADLQGRLLAAARRAGLLGSPLKFGGTAYSSRVLYPQPLP